MHYVIMAVVLIGMLSSLVTAGVGGRKSFDAQTDYNIGIYKLSTDEYQTADLDKIQKDRRTAHLKAAGGIAEAAIGAQGIAAPGVTPNPIGLGFTEGTAIGQLAGQFAEEIGAPDAPSDSAAAPAAADPAADIPAELRQGGVAVATAPDRYHVAWYAVIDGERYLMVTPMDAFNHPEKLTSLTNDTISYDAFEHVVPVAITNAWSDSMEIIWRIGESATNWHREGEMKCTIAGVRYNCEYSEYLFGEYINPK